MWIRLVSIRLSKTYFDDLINKIETEEYLEEKMKPKDLLINPLSTMQKWDEAIIAALTRDEKNLLTVALIDRLDVYNQVTYDRWKTVEMKLVQRMVRNWRDAKDQLMASFDGAGWCNVVKITSVSTNIQTGLVCV